MRSRAKTEVPFSTNSAFPRDLAIGVRHGLVDSTGAGGILGVRRADWGVVGLQVVEGIEWRLG